MENALILYQIITTNFFKKTYRDQYGEFECGYGGLRGKERNSKRTDDKFLLLEISISRKCSSVKCQNVCNSTIGFGSIKSCIPIIVEHFRRSHPQF